MLTKPPAQNKKAVHWSSSRTFAMAAIGAAVGLGNIWRFPYVAGESGGGAFVVIYVIAVFCIVLPLLIAELLIGRIGQMSPPNAVAQVAEEVGASTFWQSIGWLGMIAAFLILSFYSVVGGWLIAYIPKTLFGAFTDIDAAGASQVFDDFLSKPMTLLAWHGAFMALTVVLVMGGLKKGIESAARYLMPLLFILLLALLVFAVIAGDIGAAIDFLLKPDLQKLNTKTVISAFGQAFFSVGVGGAILINYGGYLKRDMSVVKSAVLIASADTLVALVAGFAIFPLIFGNGLSPTQGPGLIFVSLPMALDGFTFGALFAAAFFMLLLIAALTSSIAILDPLARLVEEKEWMGRRKAVFLAGIITWLFGILTIFSFNIWSDVAPLGHVPGLEHKTYYDLIDGAVSYLLMPVGGLLLAVFVGWILPISFLAEQLKIHSKHMFAIFYWFLRYVAPIAIVALIVTGLFPE